jgi:hypothetical protein
MANRVKSRRARPLRNFAPQIEQHRQLRTQYRAAKAQFISTEIDLAITFCNMAFSTHDASRRRRNSERAREAYCTATHFMRELDPPSLASEEIAGKLETLRRALERLYYLPLE